MAGVLPGAALFALSCAAQAGAPPPGGPAELVRRAVHKHLAEEATHHPQRFFWHKKDEKRDTTREVMETPQGDVAMLVAVHGAPPSQEQQQAEFARLDNLATHPELQEHRRKREAEDNARIDKLMGLLPDALIYRYESTEPCKVSQVPEITVPGVPAPAVMSAPHPEEECYRMSFTPDPKFDPPDMTANILRGMAGEIWISTAQERLVRLQAHLISDVQFGWGFVGRLNKGGTVYLEQSDVGGGDWELTRMDLNLTGKLLLFKSLTVQISEEEGRFQPLPPGTDYRKAIQMLKTSAPWKPLK